MQSPFPTPLAMRDVEAPVPARKSLRARGWLATLCLLAYMLVASLYIAAERGKILENVRALERLTQHEKALELTQAALGSALLEVSQSSNAESSAPPPVGELRLSMEALDKLFDDLSQLDTGYALLQRTVRRSHEELRQAPVRAGWIDLREILGRVADELEIRGRRLRDERELLTAGFQRQYDAVTVQSLLLAMLGLVSFGSMAAWFLAGLTHDIGRLQDHALQIVRGRRGVALAVRREDELGRLMHAVNRMAADLDERDKQIELAAQQRSHQDKMLTLGALAAGVAHEVNNPLAVIGGAAQELLALPEDAPRQRVAESVALILGQVQRAGQAARHLAELAAPRPAELDWLDLNALLAQCVQLMGYDRRYRRFDFEVQAEAELPAVRSSARSVQQVLMQLLSLVCGALAADGQVQARLQVITLREAGGVAVRMQFQPTLDFNRGEVQSSLLLCRSIVEPLGGRLAFDQVSGPLQRIQFFLPAHRAGDEG